MALGRVGRTVAMGAAALAAATMLPLVAGPAAAATATTVLTGDVLPGIDSLAASPLAGSTPVRIGITFSNPNAAAQQQAYDAIYTEGSPSYHKFLTPDEVAAQFGLPDATFNQAVDWASRDGLRPIFSSNTNQYLLLAGTAAQAQQTFSVSMKQFHWNGKDFYANTNAPTVPAGLDINGVIGLNDFLRSHTFNHQPAASAPHGAANPAQGQCALKKCVGLATPADLWRVYGQPMDLKTPGSNFGQGQEMAVLGEGNVKQPLGDLRLFEKEFGLPQIQVVIKSIGDTFKDTSGTEEWDIDSQASTGMAPKALRETWIFADSLTDANVEAEFAAFQAAPKIMEANASFGECEEDASAGVQQGLPRTDFGGFAGDAGKMFTQASENTLQQATLEGKTLFSSTGDTGSSCPVVYGAVIGAGNGVLNQADPETNYPASSPYAVAVGGTVLYTSPNTAAKTDSNANRVAEYPWNFTGGGDTFYIQQPSYQHGISILDNVNCVTKPDGSRYNPAVPCRGIPDVAAISGDVASNGYAITFGGASDFPGGGTSLSSPLWMGMWARIQAANPHSASKFGYTTGFANPSLYQVGLNKNLDKAGFFDIGAGTPTAPENSNGIYTSLPRSPGNPSGWDFVSGLGTPNICNLTRIIDGLDNCDSVTHDIAQATPRDCGQAGLSPCTTSAGCVATGDLWRNPQHVAVDLLGNEDPQLSLSRGRINVSPDGKTLKVRLTVADLTKDVPTGAAADEWYMLWSYNGTTYFADAELTADTALSGGDPTFGDGTVTVTGTEHSYNNVNDDTGKFTTGQNGIVEIDVPVANVGGPKVGDVFTGPAGETDIEVGAPHAGGFLEKVDTGGPQCNYQVGTGAVSAS
jgi:pseudomonalisin